MSTFEFKLENIKELDNGKPAIAFNQAVKRAVEDILDRPGMSKPRSVTLKVILSPTVDTVGELYDVKVKAEVNESIPKRASQVYSMGARKGGMLVFNEMSPGNIHQKTIDDDE